MYTLLWSFRCIAVLTALFLCNCNKAENEYQFPQQLRDYFIFEQGSWWKYQEVNSGAIDSCAYRLMFHGMKSGYKTRQPLLETFRCRINFRQQPYEYYATFVGQQVKRSRFKEPAGVYCEVGILGAKSVVYFEWINSSNDSWLGEPIPSMTVLPTYDVHGITFQNVLRSIIGYTDGGFEEMYFAPHIGMIKCKMVDNTNWELIDYHVE